MILRGIFWDFLGKMLSQGFSFIASIFLARLLLPDDFGLIAIALVFINISQVFIDAGFGAALIQKKEVSENLYSSVFWINFCSGVILTVLFFFISKWISGFYSKHELIDVLKYLSFAFLINSLGVIQRVQLIKKMNFKTLSILSTIATVISGIVAVIIAYETKSYWALVIQQLTQFFINTILLWTFNSWKPKLHFKISDLKTVWAFSSRQFADGILTSFVNSLDTILIGKAFPIYSLGLYSRAKNLSEMVRSYSSSGVASVLFPAISNIQDQSKKVERLYLKMNSVVTLFSVGLALVLFIFAEPLILFLYTSKWAGSILFFQILILFSFLHPLNAISLNTLNGLGHINITFKYGLIKKSIRILTLLIALQFSISVFAIAVSVNLLINYLLNTGAVRKKLNIKYSIQYKPVIFNLIFGTIAFFIGYGIDSLIETHNLTFYLLKFLFVISTYLLLQRIFNQPTFNYLVYKIKGFIKNVI